MAQLSTSPDAHRMSLEEDLAEAQVTLQGLAIEAAYARKGGEDLDIEAIVERMASTEERIRTLSQELDGLKSTEDDLTMTTVILDGQATKIAMARQNGDAAAEELARAALNESTSHLRSLYDDLSTSTSAEDEEIKKADAIAEMKLIQSDLAHLAREREEARQSGDRSKVAVITAKMRSAALRAQTLYSTVKAQ